MGKDFQAHAMHSSTKPQQITRIPAGTEGWHQKLWIWRRASASLKDYNMLLALSIRTGKQRPKQDKRGMDVVDDFNWISNSMRALPVQLWKLPKEARQGWHFKWMWRKTNWSSPLEQCGAEGDEQSWGPKRTTTLWPSSYVWHRLGCGGGEVMILLKTPGTLGRSYEQTLGL